jgi:hypothetical protein
VEEFFSPALIPGVWKSSKKLLGGLAYSFKLRGAKDSQPDCVFAMSLI